MAASIAATTAASGTAKHSIKITVTDHGCTDEGSGTSTTYTDSQDKYDKPHDRTEDRISPGQMYVARGVPKGNVVSVKEKHGSFRAAVPCMPLPMAIICCLLNIFTPGIGTFISAFTVLCCGYTETTQCKAFFWNLLAALLQAITFVFIVGWIWSISWGMTFVTLSEEYEHIKRRRARKYQSTSPTLLKPQVQT